MPCLLAFEQWVPFPLESVFAFFSNPENLPRIMPATSNTRLIALNLVPPPITSPGVSSAHAAGVGSTVGTSFRVFPFLPIRAQWVARITEFEWNHYFSWHHRHEFQAETRAGVSGTLVRDVIDYEIGFGFLGITVNALFVHRQIEGTFATRQRALPELLSQASAS